jgi:beta-galactosidase
VRGFNYRIKGIDPYHFDHQDQPVVGTEMGSTVTTRGIYAKDTVRCYLPDEDLTAPWWANRAEEWWPMVPERNWFMGGFVWTGFDYRGEPTPFQWPNINSHFGLMDMCGFPKNIYYYYQSMWTEQPMLHVSPHWNWAGKEGQPIDVWVNSNTVEVELFLNGKSLGKKKRPLRGHLQWSVPYQPGTLEAVSVLPKGKTIRAKVETTGAPYRVVLTPDRRTLTADDKDATVVNVSVQDQQGREVPDAANLIRFKATGQAAIIGVGNGDPSSHEPDRYLDGNYQRRAFNGKCQLILQAGHAPGPITLEATAEGLLPETLQLNTISAQKQ